MELIPEVAKSLWETGMIGRPIEIDFDCVKAEFIAPLHEIAMAASLFRGGQWRGFPHGVSGVCGSLNGWILPDVSQETMDELNQARATAFELTGKRAGYSSGSAARNIMTWALEKCHAQEEAKSLLVGGQIAYHDCDAGRHRDCELIDIKSCYFQLMTRLPTPKLTLDSQGEIRRHPLRPDEKQRLRDAYQAIADNKRLRNCVWGTSLGTLDFGHYYKGGKKEVAPPFSGPFQTAALLIARMAWELTRAASEECNAVYSKTDGVIIPRGTVPITWERFNIKYDTKASGNADIRLNNVYRIGNKQTKHYQAKGRFFDSVARQNAPMRLYTNEWL